MLVPSTAQDGFMKAPVVSEVLFSQQGVGNVTSVLDRGRKNLFHLPLRTLEDKGESHSAIEWIKSHDSSIATAIAVTLPLLVPTSVLLPIGFVSLGVIGFAFVTLYARRRL